MNRYRRAPTGHEQSTLINLLRYFTKHRPDEYGMERIAEQAPTHVLEELREFTEVLLEFRSVSRMLRVKDNAPPASSQEWIDRA